MNDFWSIDGPSGFLNRAKAIHQDGRSIVALLPSYVAPGFVETLRLALRADNYSPRAVRTDAAATPHECVAVSLGYRLDDSSQIPLLERIVGHPGTVVIHVPNSDHHHERWLTWARAVGAISRDLAQTSRLRFVLALEGHRHPVQLNDPACIALEWSGIIREIDCLVAADRMLTGRQCTPIEKAVVRSVLAAVAGWDPELLSNLARCSTVDLCTVAPLIAKLAEFGRRRGWSSITPTNEKLGTAAKIEGRLDTHSCILALNGMESEITALLWRAEASALLPWIDEERFVFAKRLAPRLAQGNVTAFLQKEIGELAFTASEAGVERSTQDRLHFLRNVRNHLAHRDALAWEDLRRCFL